jgi:16S rRNA C967 or C1407 C5-methylase (RsmB/RsmF family)
MIWQISECLTRGMWEDSTTQDGCVFPKVFPEGFDRILVDVPCSSDGTMRKELKRLQRWKVSSALNHHGLQLRLLCRGLELLKPGGAMENHGNLMKLVSCR